MRSKVAVKATFSMALTFPNTLHYTNVTFMFDKQRSLRNG